MRPRAIEANKERLYRKQISNLKRDSRFYEEEMITRGKEMEKLNRIIKEIKHLVTDKDIYNQLLTIVTKYEKRNTCNKRACWGSERRNFKRNKN